MTALADLQAAVAKLQTDVTALIAAQTPAPDSVTSAEAEAVVAQLGALDTQVVAATPVAPAAPAAPAAA